MIEVWRSRVITGYKGSAIKVDHEGGIPRGLPWTVGRGGGGVRRPVRRGRPTIDRRGIINSTRYGSDSVTVDELWEIWTCRVQRKPPRRTSGIFATAAAICAPLPSRFISADPRSQIAPPLASSNFKFMRATLLVMSSVLYRSDDVVKFTLRCLKPPPTNCNSPPNYLRSFARSCSWG